MGEKPGAETGTKTRADSPVVVVANRLPVDQVTDPDGTIRWQRSPGGLVTALEPFVAGSFTGKATLGFHWHDVAAGLPAPPYDAIASNPPFHAQGAVPNTSS